MPAPPFIMQLLARKYFIIAASVLLALAVLWYFTRPKPAEVTLATVTLGTVEASVNNTRAGTVKACRRAKMAPPAGGQITQLLVKKGQRVKQGQLLLRLWSQDLQAQDRLAQDQLATAEAQKNQACNQASLAEKEATRAHLLSAQGFISPQGLDQKDSAAKVARSGCDAAHAQVEQARSRIAVVRADLARMTLHAPFDGIIADISGEQGEFATPSPPGIPTPPAIDLIDDSCMYVSAPIDEVDAAHVKVGQPARITLDALKGKVFDGKVRRIAPYVLELEKQARTVEVEVEFTSLQHADGAHGADGEAVDEKKEAANLLVGYSADVEIIYDHHDNVPRIPTSALLEGNKVLLYRPDGVLESRKVETGLSNWDMTEITKGLTAGDRVVLSLDRPGVKPGAKARPDKPKPAK